MSRGAAIGTRLAIALRIASCAALWTALGGGGLAAGAASAEPLAADSPDDSTGSPSAMAGRYPAWLSFDDTGPFDPLAAWYPLAFIRSGIDLKDFIRSEAFGSFRRAAGDAAAVDAIYVRALSMTGGNTALALLASAAATLDHYRVGLRVPVLDLQFPLSNETFEDFASRIRNLPARFYADSPGTGHGDRDKLQHFFGSAFVAFAFESRGAAERVGAFVETGEDAFIVGGVSDERDARANRDGREFGAALLENNHRYPSEFFMTLHAERGDPAGGTGRDISETTGCR